LRLLLAEIRAVPDTFLLAEPDPLLCGDREADGARSVVDSAGGDDHVVGRQPKHDVGETVGDTDELNQTAGGFIVRANRIGGVRRC
jgi:hypothetical protein